MKSNEDNKTWISKILVRNNCLCLKQVYCCLTFVCVYIIALLYNTWQFNSAKTIFAFCMTSWVAIVTPTDRPKSVRNRCVIEVFYVVFVFSSCFLDCSVSVGAFVIGLSQISSFFTFRARLNCDVEQNCVCHVVDHT